MSGRPKKVRGGSDTHALRAGAGGPTPSTTRADVQLENSIRRGFAKGAKTPSPTLRKLSRDLGRPFEALQARWAVHGSKRGEEGPQAAAVETATAWCTTTGHSGCEVFLNRSRTCKSFRMGDGKGREEGSGGGASTESWVFRLDADELARVGAMADTALSTSAVPGGAVGGGGGARTSLSGAVLAFDDGKVTNAAPGSILTERVSHLNLDARVSTKTATTYMQVSEGQTTTGGHLGPEHHRQGQPRCGEKVQPPPPHPHAHMPSHTHPHTPTHIHTRSHAHTDPRGHQL